MIRIRGGVVLGLVAVLGCNSNGGSAPAGPAARASASAAAVQASASVAQPAATPPPKFPVPPEKVAQVVNPKNEPPYSGPVGTLKGTVRVKGDPPPATDFKFPKDKCPEAESTYGKLFRVGKDGALADAMVAVTQYDGYVPAKEEAKKITIRGCAFARRTLVATYGQRIEIYNLDPADPYMPYLDGSNFTAIMVAIPKGDAVRYYPQEPGHYMLRDQLPHPWMTADVFTLKYSTHAVTDLDGQYEITGIPVGKVRVDAFLPVINESAGQEIEIKEGDNTLDLVLVYDKDKAPKKPIGPPTPPPPGPKD